MTLAIKSDLGCLLHWGVRWRPLLGSSQTQEAAPRCQYGLRVQWRNQGEASVNPT